MKFTSNKNKKKQILTIDDNQGIRQLLEYLLRDQFDVVTKKDGLEGLLWLDKGNIPDLILLDLQMPVLGGIEFLKNIRTSGFFKDIPVIVLSGREDTDQRKDLNEIEMIMEKPFDPDLLLENINKVLSN